MFLSKYGVARHIYIPIVKRAVVDFAVGADWTPAAGDVKISKDGGAAANVTNLPTAIAMGNTAYWDYSLTATEMQAAQVMVTVGDAATKAVEDQFFVIQTYGHASAMFQVDLADIVRMGLTALPNAAAEAAGGLYTRGAGAGQINQQTNGQVDANVARWLNSAPDALSSGKIPADVKLWLAAAPAALTASGYVQAILLRWLTDNAGGTPSALISGRPDVNAQVIGADAVNAAALAADAGTEIGTAVWASAVRALTDKAGFALTAAYDPAKTAAQLGDAMTLTAAYNAAKTAAQAGDAMALTVAERAAVADKLLGRSIAGGADGGGRTVTSALRRVRNRNAIAGGVLTTYQEDDTTPDHTAAVTTAASNPISEIDPA